MPFYILFSVFATLLLSSAAVVVFSKNTLYSALALIVSFFNAAALLLMAGAEFISFVLMVVYVGAVAVLFVFIIMMLNLKKEDLAFKFGGHLAVVLAAASVLVAEVVTAAYCFQSHPHAFDLLLSPRPRANNIMAIGQLLYTQYAYIFQVSGMILFVAMIGAIVLTLGNKRSFTHKKQNARAQALRNKENSLLLTTPSVGAGIDFSIVKSYQADKKASLNTTPVHHS